MTVMGRAKVIAEVLWSAGFLAAEAEAEELIVAAGGEEDLLEALLARRLTGEPLAWITGQCEFRGLPILVHPGVYVPRRQSECLAQRAMQRLPPRGVAIDVCTGSGAIAKAIGIARPEAWILASDHDERAVTCARANGVRALLGDLFAPLPQALEGRVDVVAGVVPYVPTGALPLLQRDTFTYESAWCYDGGSDGADMLRRVLTDARRYLRPGGALLLELGGEQAQLLDGDLARLGYVDITVLLDDEGDVRGVEATLGPGPS